MNSLIKIFVYLVLSVLIGALLAPLFYEMILLLPADRFGFMGPLLSSVQQMPFHRYVSRTIQIAALVLLWPTIRSLKIERLSDLSLYRNNHAGGDFLKGFVVALLPLWFLEALFIKLQWYLLKGLFSWQIGFKILTTALTVAFLEEFLFRGVLLGLMRCFLKSEAAIVLVALLFAGVHFLNLSHFKEPTIHWWSGFSLLLHSDRPWSALPLAIGAFGTLFLLGVILAWATVRTASLWLAIGLHAGWIFAQQLFHAATQENFTSLLPWWGPFQIYGMVPVGLLVVIPLGVTTFLIRKIVSRRRDSSFR
ncbi:MAG: CPBP family intramembrane metalloprotease [Chthoniobacterales bacterium]|nr:CPBP family intramembrane metalloprotease [Chthoniobacterales bacterium]